MRPLVCIFIFAFSFALTLTSPLLESRTSHPLVGFCWASTPLSDLTLFEEGIVTAHHLGCEIEHRQYNWNQIEKDKGVYNWNDIDNWYHTCLKYEIVPSLAVCPVNSNSQMRNIPLDLQGKPFNDPDVILRLTQFTQILLDKYPEIEYVSFGNEINYYLRSHPDDVLPYLELCHHMYAYMKENYPNVPVLVIFGFTGMIKEEEEMISHFLPACDLVGISTYHACISLESVTPPRLTDQEMREGLEYCINLCSGKRFCIVETCAFSYPDPAYQVKYIHVFFDVIRDYSQDMEFACWLGTYDGYPGTLTMMDPFLEQFNTAGLLTPDGTPKASYYAWMEEMSRLGIIKAPDHRILGAVSLMVICCLLLLREP